MSRARTLVALIFLALLPAAKADPPAPANEEEKPIDFEPIPIEEGTPKPPTPAEWQSATRVR
ncbi:MAG TPA: hypothetical protein VM694_43515, partial [Polyangium sp.]|nr:hypothetical protein [Polyangium sp.]